VQLPTIVRLAEADVGIAVGTATDRRRAYTVAGGVSNGATGSPKAATPKAIKI